MSRGIPNPNTIKDPAARAWAVAVTEQLRTIMGQIGSVEERMTRVGELKDIGSIGIERVTRLFRKPVTEPAPIANTTPHTSNITVEFDATAGKAIGVHNLSIGLPLGAQVTLATYVVNTTFTSATDAGTIAIGVATDDPTGIVAAIAINHASNPWDAGDHATIQTGNAANYTEPTTASGRLLIVTVGVEALTAGKFTLTVYYTNG